MAFLFSGLYEAIPDIDLYLERIEYHGDRRPTLDNLKELMWKNLTHIPYGNLDFYRNQKCPSLAIPDIFEKIIVKHGCGGCFEINLLFFALLKSLGYDLFPVIVKCLFGSADPVVPTHCAAIVTIDNSRYYVDVGLGLPSPVVPVALDEGCDWQPAVISPHYYSYKMHQEGNTILFEGYNGSKRMSMVSFVLQPVELVDLIPLNYYACMADTSPVTQGIIVETFRENGTASVLKNRLTIASDDKVEKRLLETDDDLNMALWEAFGIKRMKLSVIFEEKPKRWGFRGDPYFWDHLKALAEEMDIITPDELEAWIKEEYLSLSGKPLTDEYMDFAVIEQFAHGGMSSGGVDNTWWMEEGIPLLKSRLTAIQV